MVPFSLRKGPTRQDNRASARRTCIHQGSPCVQLHHCHQQTLARRRWLEAAAGTGTHCMDGPTLHINTTERAEAQVQPAGVRMQSSRGGCSVLSQHAGQVCMLIVICSNDIISWFWHSGCLRHPFCCVGGPSVPSRNEPVRPHGRLLGIFMPRHGCLVFDLCCAPVQCLMHARCPGHGCCCCCCCSAVNCRLCKLCGAGLGLAVNLVRQLSLSRLFCSTVAATSRQGHGWAPHVPLCQAEVGSAVLAVAVFA